MGRASKLSDYCLLLCSVRKREKGFRVKGTVKIKLCLKVVHREGMRQSRLPWGTKMQPHSRQHLFQCSEALCVWVGEQHLTLILPFLPHMIPLPSHLLIVRPLSSSYSYPRFGRIGRKCPPSRHQSRCPAQPRQAQRLPWKAPGGMPAGQVLAAANLCTKIPC